MARISTYALDAVPELSDKVIGTDTRANVAQKNKKLFFKRNNKII